MAQLVGLGDVAKLLGIESRVVKRPGNRLWELIRAGRIDLPYVRIGRLYRFDLDEVSKWWQRKTREQKVQIYNRAA